MNRDARDEMARGLVEIGDGAVDACLDRPRIHARGDRHHDARRAGEAARAQGSRPSRRRAPSPTSRSTARTRTSRRCSGAAALVFKNGDLVVKDGEVTHYRWGRALTAQSAAGQGDGAAAGGLSPAALRPVARLVHFPRFGDRARTAFRRGAMPQLSVNGVVDRRYLCRSLRHARDRDRHHRRRTANGRGRRRSR